MEEVQFTSDELQILRACLEFVEDSPVSFEAIDGYTDIDEEDLWNTARILKEKLMQY